MSWVFPLVFLTAGLFGMLGLGGAVLYVPLLSWAGLDLKTGAIPLSLLLGSLTGFFSLLNFLRARQVHLQAGAAATLMAFLGAPLGAWALGPLSTGLLKILFSLAIFTVSLNVILSREPHPHERRPPRTILLSALLMGGVAGFLSGLLGIGGGFIIVPTLLALGFPTREAVGTSSLVVTFSALAAFGAHLPSARFDPWLAVVLGLGAAAGAFTGGRWVAHHAPPHLLRKLAGMVLFLAGIRVFYEGVLN